MDREKPPRGKTQAKVCLYCFNEEITILETQSTTLYLSLSWPAICGVILLAVDNVINIDSPFVDCPL